MNATTEGATTMNYNLRHVEDGFASVVNDDGREVGQVTRDKRGSTRTGTMWLAQYRVTSRVVLDLGWTHTRAAAVDRVTERADLMARRAARETATTKVEA